MTLKKYIFLAGLLLLLPLISGCMSIGLSDNSILRGRVFKHYRLPYTIDLHNTPVTDSQARGLIIHIEEPVSGYGLYTEFNSNAIGDIAKKHGLTKVYFADIEIFDVLGIWYHERLHIYGE
ncbi:MAG: hypothetical protein SWH54_05430 [Thermodesulfobacteriota bacterium]|nr:hypothetical protein [Thermodesulfobacteriota bacterium]